MLTRLTIRNFKLFEDVDIELGNPVVFIGPNNSGKTTALQALALWNTGLRRWSEQRRGRNVPQRRNSVPISRRDLLTVPVPQAKQLWRNLRVSQAKGRKIPIRVGVAGDGNERDWQCNLEFRYSSEELLYCRPVHKSSDKEATIPDEAYDVRIAFLPPMSGLESNEPRLDAGAINVRIGEGRTAEVLRNLCYRVFTEESGEERWRQIVEQIRRMFGVSLDEPTYIPERGEIEMTYRNPSGEHNGTVHLDLSSTGRGLLQTLLLLVYMAANPGAVLLLDEPDAHLEILGQREIYDLLNKTAQRYGSQIIAASHSEVVLNEAADRDVVVAFLGRPHRIDSRGKAQLKKALEKIRFEDYYQAEQAGWTLYLEGSTNLAILQAFAATLGRNEAQAALARPFVHYLGGNEPNDARDHFYGLREAKPALVGFVLVDRIEPDKVQDNPTLHAHSWGKREIENYLCQRETLLAWARDSGGDTAEDWLRAMEDSMSEVERLMRLRGDGSPWSDDAKVSDDFPTPLFRAFYERLGLDNQMNKSNFHALARYVPRSVIDPEVGQVLDEIVAVSKRAKPVQ